MKKVFFFYFLLLLPVAATFAQTMDDLGVVWSKTYGAGNLVNIKPIKLSLGGGYVAAGQAWNGSTPAGVERCKGLIIEIDESGNEIRRATAYIPAEYINAHTDAEMAGAQAQFTFAFKTDDGGYLAFGQLTNSTAPAAEREYTFGTIQQPHTSQELINGTWIVKFNADGTVSSTNILRRGRRVVDGWQMTDGTFIVGGFDATSSVPQQAQPNKDITMLRKYNQNGSIALDRRDNLLEITSLQKYPDGTYLASTLGRILKIDNTFSITAKQVNVDFTLPNTIGPYVYSVSPMQGGAVFVAAMLQNVPDGTDEYNLGAGLYKVNSALSSSPYNKRRIPADTLFYAPLLLPGSSPAKYVGAARIVLPPGLTTPNYQPGYYMYEWTDNGSTYSCRFSNAALEEDRKYPNNTQLRLAGQTDGFFSVGQSSAGMAAIAKISVCANFKLNVGATDVSLPARENSTVNMSARTVNWSGQNGSVAANWTLTDITPGGAAVTIVSGGTSGSLSGSGAAIPAHAFKLNAGKSFALLRYTITAVDSYVGGPCQQTQNILIRINVMPDNVIEADCYSVPPPTVWDIRRKALSDTIVQYLATPFAGDIDGDGRVEVVVPDAGGGQTSYNILIFDDQLKLKRKIATPVGTPQHFTTSLMIADLDNDGKAEIIVGGIDKKLRCFSPDGAIKWTADTVYNTSSNGNHSHYGVSLIAADVTGTGNPVILACERIYSKNGKHLLTLPPGGRGYAEAGPESFMPVFADLDNDGIQEVAAGNTVYKLNITNFSDSVGNSATAIHAPPGLPDGFTSVADIDMDGDLDVIVTGGNNVADQALMYVWDGATSTLIGTPVVVQSTSKRISRAFAGDIRGDGRPEIAFTYRNRINAYRFTGSSFVPLWGNDGKTTTDDSGATTLSMFDFNQDGKVEIVYRDARHLRIMDEYGNNIDTIRCYSSTHTEYPIIVDLDRDGHADIVVTGGETGNEYQQVKLFCFSSLTPGAWAPARSVWNQHAYNAVNINEDLSIPRYPFSPTTVFPNGKRPYNNFLQQQTTLNTQGDPLWLTPKAKHIGRPVFDYDPSSDSLTVTVKAYNGGDAAFQAPFRITVHKNAVVGTPRHTYAYPQPILAGDTATITFGIPHFKAQWVPFDKIVIRLNDAGNGYSAQIMCDSTLRDYEAGVIAVDDRATVFKNSRDNRIAVTANDINACHAPGSFIAGIADLPQHGSAHFQDTLLVYEPATDYTGPDTMSYYITCNGVTDTARVYIVTGVAPDNVIDADCYGDPPATPWTIGKLAESTLGVTATTASVNHYLIPVAGDIDGDGKVEIITGMNDATTVPMHNINKLTIFEMVNNALVVQQQLSLGAYINTIGSNMGIANVDGNGYAAIFVATSTYGAANVSSTNTQQAAAAQRKLVKYVYNGTQYVLYKPVAQCPQYSTILNRDAAQPMFADFNGDGIPEVVLLDKVYDARTLTLLADGGIQASTFPTANYRYGLGYGGHMNNNLTSTPTYKTSHMAIADMDNDGIPEVVAGHCVYKVNITNTSEVGTNTFQLWSKCDSIGPGGERHNEVRDGATTVADIDGDGFLDVIVTGYANGTNNASFYIWNPRTKHVMHTTIHNALPSWINGTVSYGPSRALAGDVDGDGQAEIVFLTSPNNSGNVGAGRLYCMKFDRATQTVNPLWTFNNKDTSGGTTLTLFDFNNDGKAELVYRDNDALYIIDGQTGQTTPANTFTGISSATANEYPLILDVNNDGRAEIVVTGSFKLWVFASDPPGNWAPARKVWNQVPYNVVNVNEDLTIPRYMLNPATVFPGADGIRGTNDDVYPYNNFLQQQTILDGNGLPLWLLPKPEHAGSPSFGYDPVADSLTVTVKVYNAGETAFQAPFRITAHRNAVVGTPRYTYAYPNPIAVGETAEITFGIKNFKAQWAPFDDIVIRLNDAGNGYNDQRVCDSVLRDYHTEKLIAANDRVTVYGNSQDNPLSVTANDIKTCSGTGNFTIDHVEAGVYPLHGTADIQDSLILYTPHTNYVGFDTLKYSITCNGETDTAVVYITIYNKPDNLIEVDVCHSPAAPFDFNMKRMWVNASAGNPNTSTLIGDLDGDGLPEVVAYAGPITGYQINTLGIYNGQTGALKTTVALGGSAAGSNGWCPAMNAVIVDADRNGMGELIFAVPTATQASRVVRSYEADTTGGTFKMSPKWTSSTTYDNPSTSDNTPQPIVVDFNGDSIPEVLIYNKIYNAATGAYLGQTEVMGTAHVGRIPNRPGNQNSNFITTADFDGDGLPEIAAGGKVYKVNFNASKTEVSCQIWSSIPSVTDGFTAVADINMDGLLDVVAVNASTWIRVWTPVAGVNNGKLLAQIQVSPTSTYQSYPFIGDIDGFVHPVTGKKYPEICVTTLNRVTAFKFNPAAGNPNTGTLAQKWQLGTSDSSGGTGITLFDFNNDGVDELVYRDETQLRVLNGVLDNAIPGPAGPGSTVSCTSGTAFEYPVIADIDGDGSANICVTCGSGLNVYESGSKPWAATRKVWNQVNYEPLTINEDLTIPAFPQPKHTSFNGKYLFNGALIQVPTMLNDETYTAVSPSPDPAVDSLWIAEYNSEARIYVRIRNQGIHHTNTSLPVSLYRTVVSADTAGAVAGGAWWMDSVKVGVNIAPGDVYTIYFDILKKNVPDQLSVRIQDDGVKYPAAGSYLDCDYSNNVGVLFSPFAFDDRVTVFVNSAGNRIAVTANDIKACHAPGSFSVGIVDLPLHGSAHFQDTLLIYEPATDYVGLDTMSYYITCAGRTDTATVYINVVEKQDNIIDADCFVEPEGQEWKIREVPTLSASNYNIGQPVLVGDIDGDGQSELFIINGGSSNTSNRAYILNSDASIRTQFPIPEGYMGSILLNAIGRVKWTNGQDTTIIVCLDATTRRLKIYNTNGVAMTIAATTGDEYTAVPQAQIGNAAMALSLADLDGDGWTEIVAGNRVFAAETGKLLCMTAGVGGVNHGWGRNIQQTAVAEVLGLGQQQICVGDTIYGVTLTNRNGMSGNQMKPLASIRPVLYDGTLVPSHDGCTQVADFDLDGYPDVVVSTVTQASTSASASNIAYVYIWSPKKNAIIASTRMPYIYKKSVPFVGNINASPYPEIVFIHGAAGADTYTAARDSITALEYDPASPNKQLKLFWNLKHDDKSGATAITLFDFNQDGISELVYRDEKFLRIINGSKKSHKTGADTIVYDLNSFACTSATGFEYPVIADIDSDGEAEIIVTGGSAAYAMEGPVRIFKSGAGTKWAPTRKVWNQYNYNAVNVNEDLTIPRLPLSPATVFPGADGILGTADDLRPYNGFLMQQTMLSENGTTLWLTPDAVIRGTITDVTTSGVSVTVKAGIINQGEAAIGPQVYVTLYSNDALPDRKIVTDSANIMIHPGDTGYVEVTIPNILDTIAFPMLKDLAHIVVRINDNGKTFPYFAECDTSNNVLRIIHPSIRLLMEKYARVNGVGPNENGTYPNPVSVFGSEQIHYQVIAKNVNLAPGNVVIRDTLPAYLNYAGVQASSPVSAFTTSVTGGTPPRDVLKWEFAAVAPHALVDVTYRATPVSGVSASQPLFVNRAYITVSDTIHVETNDTYHQGAGISLVTFSAGLGGRLYNAAPQAIDYRTSPHAGVVVAPEAGYRFAGWTHDAYTSLRAVPVPARSGVMHLDTLTVYGDVELRAVFEPEEYPIRYYLNGGANAEGNPSVYTVVSDAITLAPAFRENDVFTGWTGSNGDELQPTVTIAGGSTGALEFYANYLYGGREEKFVRGVAKNINIWSYRNDLYVLTSGAGGIVRIYTPEGILQKVRMILSAGETKIRLPRGVYIVTLNNGVGTKVVLE